MDFYELIPKSSVVLQCANQQLCSVIRITFTKHDVPQFREHLH
jgi:hypothetical protein